MGERVRVHPSADEARHRMLLIQEHKHWPTAPASPPLVNVALKICQPGLAVTGGYWQHQATFRVKQKGLSAEDT